MSYNLLPWIDLKWTFNSNLVFILAHVFTNAVLQQRFLTIFVFKLFFLWNWNYEWVKNIRKSTTGIILCHLSINSCKLGSKIKTSTCCFPVICFYFALYEMFQVDRTFILYTRTFLAVVEIDEVEAMLVELT